MPRRGGLRLIHMNSGFNPCVWGATPFWGCGPGDLNTFWKTSPTNAMVWRMKLPIWGREFFCGDTWNLQQIHSEGLHKLGCLSPKYNVYTSERLMVLCVHGHQDCNSKLGDRIWLIPPSVRGSPLKRGHGEERQKALTGSKHDTW